MVALDTLSLENNQLKSIPKAVRNLKNLKELNVK